jgi:apolipoprotein N-acyltransferase
VVLAVLAQLRLLLYVELLLQTVATEAVRIPQPQTLGAAAAAQVLIMEQVAMGGLLLVAAIIVLLAEVGLVVMGEDSKLLPQTVVVAAALGWATMAELGQLVRREAAAEQVLRVEQIQPYGEEQVGLV